MANVSRALYYRIGLGSSVRSSLGNFVWGVFDLEDEDQTKVLADRPCGRGLVGKEFYWSERGPDGRFQVDLQRKMVFDETMEILPPISVEECPIVWAAGLNYHKHAQEVKMEAPKYPTLFVKSPTVINGPNGNVVTPKVCNDELDYEGELAIIIRDTCKDVSVERAKDYILGFTIANDISSRRWQGKKGGGQWCRSKSYDTFLPLGPAILSYEAMDRNASIKTTLFRKSSGETMTVQNSSIADMIFSPEELVSFISQDTTLRKNTIIITGTPEGVGFTRNPPLYMQPGDEVSVSIDRIGTISNKIV